MVHVGCCSFSFGWLGLVDALALVRSLGFDRVDVSAAGPGAQVNQLAAAANRERMAATVREALGRAGLAPCELFLCGIWVDGRGVVPNDPDRAAREAMLEQFARLCRFARLAGFDSVMGVPGRPQPALAPQAALELSADTLGRMVAIATDEGVRLDVEPHVGSIVQEPRRALRLAREVPGLFYTLDYAHFIGQGFGQADVAPLLAHAGHMHAKPARPGYMKCGVEHSAIEFAPIFRALRRLDWDGTITMECIGSLEQTGGGPRPTYRALAADGQPEPVAPGSAGHPVYQTLAMGQIGRASCRERV